LRAGARRKGRYAALKSSFTAQGVDLKSCRFPALLRKSLLVESARGQPSASHVGFWGTEVYPRLRRVLFDWYAGLFGARLRVRRL